MNHDETFLGWSIKLEDWLKSKDFKLLQNKVVAQQTRGETSELRNMNLDLSRLIREEVLLLFKEYEKTV